MSLTSQASGRSHSTAEEDDVAENQGAGERAGRASASCSSEEDSQDGGGSRRRRVRRPSRQASTQQTLLSFPHSVSFRLIFTRKTGTIGVLGCCDCKQICSEQFIFHCKLLI